MYRGERLAAAIFAFLFACEPSKDDKCKEAGERFEQVIVGWAAPRFADDAAARDSEAARGAAFKRRFAASCADVPEPLLAEALACLRKPDMAEKYARAGTVACPNCDLACVGKLGEVEEVFQGYVRTRLPKEGKPKTKATRAEIAAAQKAAGTSSESGGAAFEQVRIEHADNAAARAAAEKFRAAAVEKLGPVQKEQGSLESGRYEARWFAIDAHSCAQLFVTLTGSEVASGADSAQNEDCWSEP